jgi:hypothetical protein
LLPCSYFEIPYIWNNDTDYENSSFFVLILYLITTPLFAQKKLQYGTLAKCWSRFQFRNSRYVNWRKAYHKRSCATISDKDGNYFFYDGSFVYNKNHKIMANGYGLLGIDPVHNRLS